MQDLEVAPQCRPSGKDVDRQAPTLVLVGRFFPGEPLWPEAQDLPQQGHREAVGGEAAGVAHLEKKRWNGWGYTDVEMPIPVSAAKMLEELAGPGLVRQDATLEEVLGSVPDCDLPEHALINPDPEHRLRHSRGQSLGDWLEL